MCIRDRLKEELKKIHQTGALIKEEVDAEDIAGVVSRWTGTVSYTHLRAHETVLDLVCRLLLEKKKEKEHSMLEDIIQYIQHK